MFIILTILYELIIKLAIDDLVLVVGYTIGEISYAHKFLVHIPCTPISKY